MTGRLAPAASGHWSTVVVDALPGAPHQPWTNLTARATVRAVAGAVGPDEWAAFAAYCDQWLPVSLADIAQLAVAAGVALPAVLDPATPICLDDVIEIGRLELGQGGPVADWPRTRLWLPFRPISKGIHRLDTKDAPARPPDQGLSPGRQPVPPLPRPDMPTPRPPSGIVVPLPDLGVGDGVPTSGTESPTSVPPDAAETVGTDTPASDPVSETPDASVPDAPADDPTPPHDLADDAPQPHGVPDRTLQARVGPDVPGQPLDNVLRVGANAVDVFLGPVEAASLVGPTVSDAQLQLDGRDWVVVHVQLTPLAPMAGRPASGDLLVPRTGRSATLRLPWEIPADADRARAQLALTVNGCVVTVAELSGAIGKPARLVGQLAIGDPGTARPAASTAVVVDADASGTTALVIPAEERVALAPEIEALAENVRVALNQAVSLPEPRTARAQNAFRIALVGAAQAGRDLYLDLAPLLGGLVDAPTVQVVTARAPHALPLELCYTRPAPRDDAVLCPTWVSGGDCGPGCGGADPGSVVCPAGFWGVARVVERHYQPRSQSEAVVRVPAPDAARSRLRTDGLLVAASEKVTDDVLVGTPLDGRVRTWDQWRAALTDPGKGLLVLMPHTLPRPPSLEVSGQALTRALIGPDLVTGGRPDALPAVVLFGCDTGGSAADPVGYPTRFLGAGAGVVFASFSLLRAGVAAALASRLVTALRDPERAGQPVGCLLTEVRRAALREGIFAALALTAYGDATWQV